jgi:hypothetical protein
MIKVFRGRSVDINTKTMLNFFRRIRKKLADENKILKYARYAIGEIVLVVVGILIALQVNNWNEDQKEKKIQIGYLKRIHADMQKDTTYLRQKIQRAQDEQQSYYDFIHSMYEVQSTKEDFTKLFSSAVWDADDLILQDQTFAEISTSGKLELISDDQLKKSIIDYYRNYTITGKHITEMNNTGIDLLQFFAPIMWKYYDGQPSDVFDQEQMFDLKGLDFINDPYSDEFRRFEGTAGFYSTKQFIFEQYYKDILLNATKLLDQIQQEIKQ